MSTNKALLMSLHDQLGDVIAQVERTHPPVRVALAHCLTEGEFSEVTNDLQRRYPASFEWEVKDHISRSFSGCSYNPVSEPIREFQRRLGRYITAEP